MKTRQSGFSLIEVSFVIVLIAVAIVALLATLAKLPLMDAAHDEEIVALQAAQTMIETLENSADNDFDELWLRYNSDDGDDPTTGESPGTNFSVDDLQVWPEDQDGFCGEIEFPESDGLLDETAWGGDGNEIDATSGATNTAVAEEDYRLLPVRVHIRFRSATGHEIIKTLETTLYGLRE